MVRSPFALYIFMSCTMSCLFSFFHFGQIFAILSSSLIVLSAVSYMVLILFNGIFILDILFFISRYSTRFFFKSLISLLICLCFLFFLTVFLHQRSTLCPSDSKDTHGNTYISKICGKMLCDLNQELLCFTHLPISTVLYNDKLQ